MMRKKIIKTIFLCRWLPVCCAMLLFACENMVQYIDVDVANQPPMLAVTATIDTDGSFFISFTEGRSLSSYRNGRSESETIIRQGKITLYDVTANSIVHLIDSSNNSGFDLSLRSSGSGYTTIVPGLHFEAGHTYRLTLELEDYPPATATALMPDAPIVKEALPDLLQPKHYRNAYFVEPFNPNTFSVLSIDCYPVLLRLADNSPDRDYYMVYLKTAWRYPGEPATYSHRNIAISDMAVVQDNPDVAASSLETDSEVSALVFEKMLLSDMSFAGDTGAINLLVDADAMKQSSGKVGDLPCDASFRSAVTTYLYVAHLTSASYAYYRSLALQQEGMGFFSEPVSIASNIENGYGCFSAVSTTRVPIAEYTSCGAMY
ncbi:MAG: DUF4249 domain-containing protein [Prevotellaceae bacterium]|jgi:hypothetical protein|nr:DUF4249 domain-containing protein [Prevotellaceae bacterium]